MFRLANNFKSLKLTIEPFTNSQQTLRWRRKPRWIPTAKSKIFKVPERPVAPLEETLELQRLHNNYKTQIKSIRRYLTYKYALHLQKVDNVEQLHQEFEDDFARCNEINNQWNAKVKIDREARFEADLQKEIKIAQERLAERMRINEEKSKQMDELVRQQKEVSGTFITPENIDEAIEKTINNVIDYNYALDADGNKINGRDTVPEEKTEISKISVKQ